MKNSTKPRLAICITALGATANEIEQALKNAPALQRNFTVIVDKRVLKNNIFNSRSVTDRIASIEWAAKNADIIMPWNGGYNSIELLFEFDRIAACLNPAQLFVGYSDNTILVNALSAKKVCRTAQGPGLWNWLRTPQNDSMWADSLRASFYQDYTAMSEQYNALPYTIFRPGRMTGKVIGGNNYTFDLLQGTKFAPSFKEPFILLLEGENFITAPERIWQDFIRNLDSIALQDGALDNMQGLLIGRFPENSTFNKQEIAATFATREYLRGIPIAYDFARGYHTDMLYLPIGERLEINIAKNNQPSITLAA